MRSLNSPLRTVDVARRAQCSVQQVRNLARDGVLPPTKRSQAGYRVYTEIHALSAAAYTTLAAGVGPTQAKTIMRAAHRPPLDDLLAMLDAAHAQLHTERCDVALARQAVAAISTEPIDQPRPADAMTISELADALGVRTSALRHWESEGLLNPDRSRVGHAHSYTPGDVRDARIVHQLRLAGHRIPALRELLPALRQAQRQEHISAALLARQDSITTRSRALLHATAALQNLVIAIK